MFFVFDIWMKLKYFKKRLSFYGATFKLPSEISDFDEVLLA